MELKGKIKPNSIEAEKSVIGAMILDKDSINDIVDLISSDDFYKESHKLIFESVLEIYNNNEPVDIVTLSDKLISEGILENIGGLDYLAELTEMGIITSNARYYAKIIEEKSTLRKLIGASTLILQKGYESIDAKELLELAEKNIFNISQNKAREGFSPIRELLYKTYEKIEMLYESDDALTGLSSGFKDLDVKTSGFQKSDLILVAARPSMGKTAFSINVCQYAGTHKSSVAIFSLEMSKDQLVQRMLSSESHISIQKIRNGDLEEDDWISLTKAMARLSEANIFIDDTPAITVMEMRAKCRKLKMEKGLDVIMVDYLQLMSGGGKQESRQQEISTISRSLKALAREMDCPVIALSQLSRAPELRADHRPILSDLRESGAIEQDADIVMFLYRDEYYFPDSEKQGIGELIIAKQRNGETGTVELAWIGKYTKFGDLAREV
ncbi:replicative DNA helicase [Helicovermis profundi]|uniref:Replicative DNA helicase n=1 Tax=Helicovermis profundi TaxID=3065157 RepID=A0AAU9EHS8_9FIRM|nr:replicative DNA helicase [Clostridia bacterium S502]